MGEQKRKHIAEIIAKAILCGAVIHEMKPLTVRRNLDKKFRWLAELPVEGNFTDERGQKVYRACGETEYQCAIDYLQKLGVPYETLIYGGCGLGLRETTRLHQRRRKRGGVPR